MRTLALIAALLLNGFIALVALSLALNSESTALERSLTCIAAVLAFTMMTFLLLVRSARLPEWGVEAMRVACICFPIPFFLGALDVGKISGLEFMFVGLVALFSWGNWYVFSRHSSAA